MADFQPFNLGSVLQTAEAIKAARSQSTTDRLREQYLGEQIQSARADRERQQRQDDLVLGKQKAQQVYTSMQYAMESPNPKNFIEQNYPELVSNLTKNGVQWETLDDNAVKQMAQGIMSKAGAEIGVGPGNLTERQKLEMQGQLEDKRIAGQQQFQRGMQEDQQQFTAGENRLNREATAARQDQEREKSLEKMTQSLRKEFRGLPTVKSYESALPIIESARNAPDTPAGDLQIVYSVGKALDPDSVVREGELQLTQNATPFLQRAIGKARAELKGKGRLTPQTRADLMSMLDQRMAGYQQAYQRDYDQYSKYATEQGLTAEQIVGTPPVSAFGQGPAAADFIYVPGKGLQPAR
jgi:hypothetical protein